MIQISASLVLKAMLTRGMEEATSKCIDIKEFSNTSVEHFLEYLYTGTILFDEDASPCLVQLWVMGDKYNVPGLVHFVESLQEHITLENMIGIYLDADTSKAMPIKYVCLALISKKTKELLVEIKLHPEHVQACMFLQLIEKGVSF